MGLEVVGLLELLAQDSMVVNFPVDSKRNGAIVVDQGLSTAICLPSV